MLLTVSDTRISSATELAFTKDTDSLVFTCYIKEAFLSAAQRFKNYE